MNKYHTHFSIIILGILIFLLNGGWNRTTLADTKNRDDECYTSYIPVLMYHHIRNYNNPDTYARSLSVSPEEFEKQLQFFHERGWKTITTSEIINHTVPCNTFMVTFDDGYYDVYTHAYALMKKYNYRGIISLIPAYIDESDYLTGKNILEMRKDDWEIASHTWTHPILTKIPTKKIEYEIGNSKIDLEKWFKAPIITLAYPGGFQNSIIRESVQRKGYKYAFTTRFGYAELLKNPFTLARINIPPGTNPEELGKLLLKAKNWQNQ